MGPPQQWPDALRVALELALVSQAPTLVAWGPELSVFYNDAMVASLGARDADALGRSAEDVWKDDASMQDLLIALRDGRPTILEMRGATASVARIGCTPIGDALSLARGMVCSWLEARGTASQRLQQLLHTVAEPVVIVREGRIEYANAQAEGAFGYSPGELVGLPHDVLVPERVRAAHAIDARHYLMAPKPRAMSARSDLTARRKDGSEFPVEISLNPVATSDGMMISTVIRDLSARRELERALRRHAEHLAAAVESIPHAFFIADERDRLVAANAATRAMLRDVGADAVSSGTEVLETMERASTFEDDREREVFRAAREAAAGRPTDVFDVRWPNGRSFRVTRQNLEGGGYAIIGIELTDELRRSRELQIARAQAEAASRSKSEFLASMSHELRTPLNAVLGFAQLLQRDKRETLSERQRAMVDRIFQGGEHLLRLVDDVLDLARIEARGVAMAPEPVAVDELVDEVMASLTVRAREADVALLPIEVGADVPMVHADRVRFAQVLMNLGSNAVKYSRAGGRIQVSITTEVRGVRVTIRDEGIGIPPEHRGRLFEAFHRAGQETGPIEGTGIGLAISKTLTELMGGTIGYRARPEGGSEFWVELPAHRSGARSSRPSSPGLSMATELGPPAPRVRVLYVEDNEANVALVRELVATLDRADFFATPTAEAGLALAREMKPDVVLMDINLPGMNGYEALAALRDAPETAAIPVVAVSAAALPADRARAARAGFAAYVTKPIRMEELEAAIETSSRRKT